jgi:hypothetical protein
MWLAGQAGTLQLASQPGRPASRTIRGARAILLRTGDRSELFSPPQSSPRCQMSTPLHREAFAALCGVVVGAAGTAAALRCSAASPSTSANWIQASAGVAAAGKLAQPQPQPQVKAPAHDNSASSVGAALAVAQRTPSRHRGAPTLPMRLHAEFDDPGGGGGGGGSSDDGGGSSVAGEDKPSSARVSHRLLLSKSMPSMAPALQTPGGTQPACAAPGTPGQASAMVGGGVGESQLGPEDCLWSVPVGAVVGEAFEVGLELSPRVRVLREDWVGLFMQGQSDHDIGGRYFIATADRLADGFLWDAKAWGRLGTRRGGEMTLEVRYFRRDGARAGGPLFVSPPFTATAPRMQLRPFAADGAASTPPKTPRQLVKSSVAPDCEAHSGLERCSDPREVGMSARRLAEITRWCVSPFLSTGFCGASCLLRRFCFAVMSPTSVSVSRGRAQTLILRRRNAPVAGCTSGSTGRRFLTWRRPPWASSRRRGHRLLAVSR